MTKRKRDPAPMPDAASKHPRKIIKSTTNTENSSTEQATASTSPVTVQIVTGSYERVLHGITATITSSSKAPDADTSDSPVQFADTFLFHAHSSAVRCLALSPLPNGDPSQPQKVILASGGTDERINLYNLSASPPIVNDKFPSVPTLAGSKILENPKNRELGSLLHHSSSISALYFPTRSKLLAAAEDNTISVTRTRDWSVVSTIKAPNPKTLGRPSGDTAPPGAAPAGVNDFAVHPSMKLMLSVGKGEKTMRLWNLVTGKKAGVLSFGREILQSVKESRFNSGEGRRILWNPEGEEFVVGFERGAVVFGTDSIPKCKILPSPLTKLHSMKYIKTGASEEGEELLAVSTEDGRIVFYSTKEISQAAAKGDKESENSIPDAAVKGQLGGKTCNLSGRIKEFEILDVSSSSSELKHDKLVVTCGSDGSIRIWALDSKELAGEESSQKKSKSSKKAKESTPAPAVPQVGKLLGTYETGNRITCMKAFVMLQPEEERMSDLDDEFGSEDDEDEEDESSDSDDED
ncbi:hypothetical protein FQN54_007360 [Arachnomyces sp. PD_36]|nr:hypothetical protein FQN54_007360 [Arachnomyces sp. PD_36]